MPKIKNTLMDLNDHLFEQIERLNDEDLDPEQLQREIDRSKAMEGIASAVISNAKVMLDAAKAKDSMYEYKPKVPMMLLGENDDES